MKKNTPSLMIKGRTIYSKTKYGSYVNTAEYGMAQQKNAMSYEELVRAGYKKK
jgi:hypothetical protein